MIYALTLPSILSPQIYPEFQVLPSHLNKTNDAAVTITYTHTTPTLSQGIGSFSYCYALYGVLGVLGGNWYMSTELLSWQVNHKEIETPELVGIVYF